MHQLKGSVNSLLNIFDTSKCKTQCSLCLSRIKLIRNKNDIQVRAMRQEIAQQLGSRPEFARIRVEAVIRLQQTQQALDMLELYLHLITTRVDYIKQSTTLPADLNEAISSVVFAATRMSSDLPELRKLSDLFAAKFGKDFATDAAEPRAPMQPAIDAINAAALAGMPHHDGDDVNAMQPPQPPASGNDRAVPHVNEKLQAMLALTPPPAVVKLDVLRSIAAEHSLEFDLPTIAHEMLPREQAQWYLAMLRDQGQYMGMHLSPSGTALQASGAAAAASVPAATPRAQSELTPTATSPRSTAAETPRNAHVAPPIATVHESDFNALPMKTAALSHTAAPAVTSAGANTAKDELVWPPTAPIAGATAATGLPSVPTGRVHVRVSQHAAGARYATAEEAANAAERFALEAKQAAAAAEHFANAGSRQPFV